MLLEQATERSSSRLAQLVVVQCETSHVITFCMTPPFLYRLSAYVINSRVTGCSLNLAAACLRTQGLTSLHTTVASHLVSLGRERVSSIQHGADLWCPYNPSLVVIREFNKVLKKSFLGIELDFRNSFERKMIRGVQTIRNVSLPPSSAPFSQPHQWYGRHVSIPEYGVRHSSATLHPPPPSSPARTTWVASRKHRFRRKNSFPKQPTVFTVVVAAEAREVEGETST